MEYDVNHQARHWVAKGNEMNTFINNINALIRKQGRLKLKRYDLIRTHGFDPFWVKEDREEIQRLDARIARAQAKARRLAEEAPQDWNLSILWGIIWPDWIKG